MAAWASVAKTNFITPAMAITLLDITMLTNRRVCASSTREHFEWGVLVVDCLKDLRKRTGFIAVPFNDYEVLPSFDGRPDDIFVWFICETKTDANRFRESSLPDATDALKTELSARGFPQAALASMKSDCVSAQEIEAGGGRFFYFR
jgi:hypothetical protein